jgi:hypothetical protein
MIVGRALLVALAILVAGTLSANESTIVAFSSLAPGAALPAQWKPLVFKDTTPTAYALVRDGETTVLRGEARASASGLTFRFDPPLGGLHRLRWRWKAGALPADADTRRRESDDAVARVYVTFAMPPSRQTTPQRMRDAMMKALYGEAPPHATLLYVWDTRAPVGARFANPYTDRVHNVVVESGAMRVGQWIDYERDVAADYLAVFGEPAPPISGVAVMTDADNTRNRSIALFGDVSLR